MFDILHLLAASKESYNKEQVVWADIARRNPLPLLDLPLLSPFVPSSINSWSNLLHSSISSLLSS